MALKNILARWPGLKALGDWDISLEANGRRYTSANAEPDTTPSGTGNLFLRFSDLSLEWNWTATVREEDVLISGELRNTGPSPIRLGRVSPFRASGKIPFAPAGSRTVVLPQPVGQVSRFVTDIAHEKAEHDSFVKAQFFNANTAVQVGFTTFHRAAVRVQYRTDDGGGMTHLEAWCDFGNWELRPGRSVPLEELRLAVGENPFRQLETWADLAADRCRPRQWEDPPLGYVGWAWVDTFNGSETSEENVLANVDAISRRLKGLGISYVWVSIANLAGGMPGNWLEWNTGRLPGGHEKLVKALQDRGFKLGLWVGPFYLSASLTSLVEEYRDALLKDETGNLLVVCPEWRHGDAGRLPRKDRPCLYALDPSHPKARAWIQNVFRTYREWGIRYYMVDFLDAGAGNIGRFPYPRAWDPEKIPGVEPWFEYLQAIREAAGDDTYLLGSTGPTIPCAGACDGIRTGNDFGEGRPMSPESFFYPASFVINNVAFWTGAKTALVNQAACYYMHRKLFLNDSGNVLTVDKPIPLETARVHATIHAFSGGPTMLGDDIRRIDEERLRLIRVTLPRPHSVALPVDLFEHPLPDYPHIYLRRVEKPWGSYVAVAVYNLDRTPYHTELDLARLGLNAEDEHLVWEFWNSEFPGKCRERLAVSVPPESVRVYRLARNSGHPVLLGTDMHLLMGEVEIENAAWNPGASTYTLEARRPDGETGSAFVYAPETVYVKNFDGLYIAKDARDNSLIIRVPLQFQNNRARHEIRFGQLSEVLDMNKLDLA